MKIYIYSILLILLFSSCLQALQTANIHKTSTPPKIDGIVNDDCYKSSLLISNLISNTDNKLSQYKASVYVTYDNDNLYVAVVGYQGFVKYSEPKRDGNVWDDDSFEIYVKPKTNESNYYQFIINGNNSMYDGNMMDGKWNSNAIYASKVFDGGYSAELAIPWKDMGIADVSVLDKIGFNATRVVQETKTYNTWSSLGGMSFHTPDKFGVITLNENVPVFQFDDIKKSGKQVDFTGKLVGNADNVVAETKFIYSDDSSDVKKEDIKFTKSFQNVKISSNIKKSVAKGEISLKDSKGNIVYMQNFLISEIGKIESKLNGKILTVSMDISSMDMSPNTKAIIKIRQDKHVFYGEAVRIDETKPVFESKFNLDKLEPGKYLVDVEIWGPISIITSLKEEIAL